MLPDFPSLKAKLHDLFMSGAEEEQANAAPLQALIQGSLIHEGNCVILIDEERGTEEKIELKKFGAEIEYDLREIEQMTLDKVYQRYKEMAITIGIEKEKHLLGVIEQATEAVGNVVDTKGEPITPDTFLDTVEKMQIDFDECGKPILPSIVVGDEIAEQVEAVIKQLDDEPYLTRGNNIFKQKRLEWRDRESNRKLVD